MKDRQLTNFTLYPAQSHYNPVQKKFPEAFERGVEENPGKARIGNAVERRISAERNKNHARGEMNQMPEP
jgi:hypothetical protein